MSWRRARQEPLHPGWSFRKELITSVMRGTFTRMSAMEPSEIRARTLPTPVPPSVLRRVRHQATTLGERSAEVFTPRQWDPTSGTVVLYLHGGGYVACSPLTHRGLVSRLAATSGARCFALDYRKAPEAPFPLPIDDCEAAYLRLLEMGVPPDRLVIGGDSAGGGLALATMLRLRDAGLPLPRCAVLLSPWVDLECASGSVQGNAAFDYLTAKDLAFAVKQYLGEADIRHPHASPIHADLRGLPPLFMQTGSAELFCTQNELFAQRARDHGVAIEHEIGAGMVHVYALFGGFVPECTSAVHRIAAFIRREVAGRQQLASG